MNLAHLIKRPIITEKSLEATKLNRYTFEVDAKATKNQIKQAVTEQFSVDVIKVSTNITKGVIKRTGRRRLPTMKPNTKKAIIEGKTGTIPDISHAQLVS